MKYKPKELKGNVNITEKSPLKSIISLLLSLLIIILIIYIGLGFAVDIVAMHIPKEVEKKIAKIYKTPLQGLEKKHNKKIQKMLNELIAATGSNKDKYKVYVTESKQANTMAYPGNNIVIFSELLKEIDSKNELSFILAHELGHFAHKDHLKKLGRSLVFFTLSVAFFGQDSSVTNFLSRIIQNTDMKFSQKQEVQADLFALRLLDKKYGNVAGSIPFLKKLQKKKKLPKFAYFFSTHPHPENRIKKMKKEIEKENYKIRKTQPLDESFKKAYQDK